MKRSLPTTTKQIRGISTSVKILEMATLEFADKGYDGTSIREIADRAQVKHSVITYHFGSKTELFTAVMESLYEETFRLADSFEFHENTINPLEKLREHLLKVAVFYHSHPEFLKIIYKEKLSKSERLVPLQSRFDKLSNLTKQNLQMGQYHGVIKKMPIEQLYILFSGAYRSLFIHPQSTLNEGQTDELNRKLEAHVDGVLQLLKP